MSVPDYELEETLDFKFTTRAFDTGIPTTLTSGVVEIYEDNSLTQITAAETLTADFDSVTGLNNLRVVATAANGFEAGKSYQCVLSAGTVGGVSVVGEVVAQFSIQRSPVNWANVTAPTTAVDLSATDIQLCDTITTYTGNTVQTGDAFARLGAPAGASVSADIADVPTVAEFEARTLVAASYFDPAADTVANVTTVATLTGHTAQTGDNFARLGAPAGASVSADIAAMKSETALIVADTNELQGDWVDGGRLDLLLDAVSTHSAADVWTSGTRTLTAATNITSDGAAINTTSGVVDTVTTVNALASAAVTDIWSTDTIPEAYPADGAAATPAQCLYLIMQNVQEFAIVSTTLTVKKLDGTTAAATYTLDSDTSPTSRTRAS